MTTRRDFIGQLSTVAAFGAVASLGWSARSTASPSVRWYMPDEHRPQARIFLAYAASPATWGDWAGPVNQCVARLARTIAGYQPVTVLCRPEQRDEARNACGTEDIDILPMPLNDIWIRDYGGCFVRNDAGELGLVDFNFNGWGGKQRAAADTRVAAALAHRLPATGIRTHLVGEGGGIEVDGQGTAIVNESCWVNDNRNPGLDRHAIEVELKARLGLRKIIWLPGIRGKDITDGHVDFYARFVRPGVIVANLENDPDSFDYPVTRAHLDILEDAEDADGRSIQVHTLPAPLNPRASVYNRGNPNFAMGYINYLPVNGALIAPRFGDIRADGYCRELLESLYPDRELVQVDIDPIASGGGGIHCATKNLPLA